MKQDINECGTGEGLQSVITHPQLQTYIHSLVHTRRHPQRGEEHTLTEKRAVILEESEIELITDAYVTGNVCFVYCSTEGFE